MSHDDVQKVRAFEHPGEGRRQAKSTPKGREIDPQAAHEIELLLGDRPRRRDLLIEHLHLIQDTYKQISAAHLAALADEMKLAFAEVFETATFYIYIRDEYPASREILEREIAKLPPGGPVLHMRRGAGAYICGEESALLESIEGKRGLPRHKPPYPFQVGLFGLPTLINNIETLFWVRDIVEKGADWWKSQGRNERQGLRSYSVSGRVKNPGMKLAPAGVTVRELIDEFCGGMADGHSFHAYLPGGASGGILPAAMNNIPLDFGTLEKYGCFIGSAAVIIIRSDQDNVKGAALNLMRFFDDESCGQCTPCRVGTQKAAVLMERGVWNRELLDELSQAMRDASICGLGQAASNPLTSVIKYFPEEFSPKDAAE
jgi:formate dehydrogenase beta subunit